MKIEVQRIDVNKSIVATVTVRDCTNLAEAVQAIEFVHDEGEVVYADAYERVREERDNLRERVDKLISSLAHAHGEAGDLGAENARLIERNQELLHQINHLGNTITKALYETSYVPF